jgi:hypothetical protein
MFSAVPKFLFLLSNYPFPPDGAAPPLPATLVSRLIHS